MKLNTSQVDALRGAAAAFLQWHDKEFTGMQVANIIEQVVQNDRDPITARLAIEEEKA